MPRKVYSVRLEDDEIVWARERGGIAAVIRESMIAGLEETLVVTEVEVTPALAGMRARCHHRWAKDPKIPLDRCLDCGELRGRK